MALTACEVTWLQTLFRDMGIKSLSPAYVHCDNKAAISIAANPVLHERTKHIEIDCHYIRDKIKSGDILTQFVPSHGQIADVLTKALPARQHKHLVGKLGTADPTESDASFNSSSSSA